MKDKVKVLGIDSQTQGIALVSLKREDRIEQYWWLPLRKRNLPQTLWCALYLLKKILPEIPSTSVVYLERPPYVKNYLTLLRLAQIQGTVMAFFAAHRFSVEEIDPPSWKRTVTGNDNASKVRK